MDAPTYEAGFADGFERGHKAGFELAMALVGDDEEETEDWCDEIEECTPEKSACACHDCGCSNK